jgi:hypothetical protein
MAAAENDELIYVRRSNLLECSQHLVNLKACLVITIERQKSILEEKRCTTEELVAHLTTVLDSVNTLNRKFDTVVNGHYRVILPDNDPSIITLAANAGPQSEGSGDRRMHLQLISEGHREHAWVVPHEEYGLDGRLNGSGPLGDVVRVGEPRDHLGRVAPGNGAGRGRPMELP